MKDWDKQVVANLRFSYPQYASISDTKLLSLYDEAGYPSDSDVEGLEYFIELCNEVQS